MQAVILRPAEAADLPAILQLERSLPNAPHWTAAQWSATLGDPRRAVFVAASSGELAGFCVGLRGHDAEAELESVAVATHAQRQGLGQSLCKRLLAWAQTHGATRMQLEVRASSAVAVGLYRQLGFVEIGCRPRYYREPEDDALLMQMALQSDV